MARSGAIIIKDSKVVLIKRVREGMTYFLIPGGQMEYNESSEETCIREIKEEVGYDIIPTSLAVELTFQNNKQYYYTCDVIGGEFNTGAGPEYNYNDESYASHGTYEPVWMDIRDFDLYDIRPVEVIDYIKKNTAI